MGKESYGIGEKVELIDNIYGIYIIYYIYLYLSIYIYISIMYIYIYIYL